MSTTKLAIGGVLMVIAVTSAAVISNRFLDSAGIADGSSLSVQERKDKARRNQIEYDHPASSSHGIDLFGWLTTKKPNRMCTDEEVGKVVKRLINEQTPNVSKWARSLQELEAARGGGLADVIKAREKTLEETKDMYRTYPIDPNGRYMGDPVAARAKQIAKLEADIERLKAKFGVEEQQKALRAPMPIEENEIVTVDEPFSMDYDPNIERVTCQVRYKVKGLGQGDDIHAAIYTVQPGNAGLITNLLSIG